MFKKFLSLTLALILTLSISACKETTEQTDELPVDNKNTQISGEEILESVATEGGTLNISMRAPKTLNPLLNEDVTVDKALSLIFEPLFYLNDKQEIEPNLAEGYLLSPDGLSVAISLKSGLSWENGSPITAADIVFSLDTIKNSGANGIYRYALENVASYEASSAATAIIRYSKPFGGAPYNLTFPIISKSYYQDNNKADSEKSFKPMGNGQFKFVSYRLAREMVMEKSSNFKGEPYISTINAIVIDDKETEYEALEKGIIDVLEVDASKCGRFSNLSSIDASYAPSNQFEFIGFNFSNQLFTNSNIRQAIAYSVPYTEIIESIYLNNAVKSVTPIHPVSRFETTDALDEYTMDIERAQALVSDSGVAQEKLNITILVNSDNNERIEIARMLSNYLSQANIKATVESVDFETYTERLISGEFDLFIGGTELNSRYNLTSLLHSASKGGLGINYFNFSDLTMDALILSCENAVDEADYAEKTHAEQRYIAKQLPLIGLGFKSKVVLTSTKLKGEKSPYPSAIFRNIDEWYIPASKKE